MRLITTHKRTKRPHTENRLRKEQPGKIKNMTSVKHILKSKIYKSTQKYIVTSNKNPCTLLGKCSARNTHDLCEGVVQKAEDGEEGGSICYLQLQS